MSVAGHKQQRPKPLDLYRRAKLLGVTPGHLSKVIAGERVSIKLSNRLNQLIASESAARPQAGFGQTAVNSKQQRTKVKLCSKNK